MAKNFFQDVTPPGEGRERSIRDIPVTRRVQKRIRDTAPVSDASLPNISEVAFSDTFSNGGYPVHSQKGYNKFKMSKLFLSIAGVAVLAFVFLMMNVFSSAVINITPKKEIVSFNLTVNASRISTSSATSSSENLKYEIIELKKQGESEVATNGEEQVERKASGKIIIYNNFSSAPQRLIARTRFETPEGLTFRIGESVTVPGKSGSTPSSIEVTVSADEAGPKYNIGLKDFTLPGFKTDALRYKGFYARSKEEIVGGFVGKMKKVSPALKDSTLIEINNSLKTDLEKDIYAKLPETLIILKGGIIFSSKEIPGKDVSGSKILIKSETTAYAMAFDKKELAEIIKNQFLTSWKEIPSQIKSFEGMDLSFGDNTWTLNKSDATQIKISGTAEFVALITKEKIAESLLGKEKKELGNVVDRSSNIESATTAIKPVWKNSFPSDFSKIKVEIEG